MEVSYFAGSMIDNSKTLRDLNQADMFGFTLLTHMQYTLRDQLTVLRVFIDNN